jgi:hypothetical protein
LPGAEGLCRLSAGSVGDGDDVAARYPELPLVLVCLREHAYRLFSDVAYLSWAEDNGERPPAGVREGGTVSTARL